MHTIKSNTSCDLNLKKEPQKFCLVDKILNDTSVGDEMRDSLPESKGPLRLLQKCWWYINLSPNYIKMYEEIYEYLGLSDLARCLDIIDA